MSYLNVVCLNSFLYAASSGDQINLNKTNKTRKTRLFIYHIYFPLYKSYRDQKKNWENKFVSSCFCHSEASSVTAHLHSNPLQRNRRDMNSSGAAEKQTKDRFVFSVSFQRHILITVFHKKL